MAASRSLPSLAGKTSPKQSEFGPVVGQLGAHQSEAMATMLSRTGHQSAHLLMAGFEALDLVNIGVIVANVSGRLLLANQTAEQILDAREGLALTTKGALQASGTSGTALGALLRQFGAPGPRGIEATGTVLAIPRSNGKRPLTLLVRPVEASASLDLGGPRVLIFCPRPGVPCGDC